MTEIAKSIKMLVGEPLVHTMVATVKEVNWSKKSCKVKTDDGREFFNVRLRAVLDDSEKGFVCKPKLESKVLISLIDGKQTSAFVVLFTDVDALELVTDKDVLKIDVPAGTIVINGGDHDGLVKVKELTEKLNLIEQDLNTIKTVFNSWTPVAQDGGGALKTAASAWSGQQLQKTQQSEIENKKVKH